MMVLRLHRYQILLCLGLLIPCSVGFVCVPSFRVRNRPASQQLFTSLTVPPPDAHIRDDNDDDPDKNVSLKVPRRRRRRHKKSVPVSHQFRNHLARISKSLGGTRECADVMYDELEKMEVRWYGGEMSEHPRCVYESFRPYNGPSIQPDAWCYAMVANAYVKSGRGVEVAELAEDVLRRCESHQTHDKYAEKPNTVLRTAVMNAWARADRWDQADEYLRQMEDTYDVSREDDDAPDTITYTVYLEALSASKSQKSKVIAKKAIEMLERMDKMADTGENEFAAPNAYTYTAVMKCQKNTVEGAQVAEDLLRRLRDLYNESGDPSYKPSAHTYMPAMIAWARSGGGIEAANRADALKEELREMYKETGDRDFLPLESHYTAVMSAYSRVKVPERSEAAKKVGEILKQIEADPDVKPTNFCYSTAMKVIAQGGDISDVIDSEEIMRRIQNPDTAHSLIKAYATAGNAEGAEKVINEMEKTGIDGRIERRADMVMYAACIHAWVKSFRNTKDPEAVERADALLRRIVSLHRDDLVREQEERVDATVFSRVIQLWAESHHPEAGERAEQILSLIEEMRDMTADGEATYGISNYAYTYVLDAWAASKHKDAANRALDILKRMDQDDTVETDCRAISAALSALLKAKIPNRAEILEGLLLRMLTLYSDGDRSSLPNARFYTSVLRAIVQDDSPDSDLQALGLFRRIRDMYDGSQEEDLAPNDISYGCVLNGLAKKGRVDETEKLFSEMKRRYADGHEMERPNLVTYSTVVEAYRNNARGDSPLRTAALLEEVEEGYRSGDAGLKPDTQFFNSVIRALASGAFKDPRVVVKAENVLKRMEMSETGDLVVKPDIISYSSVCLAYANGNTTDAADKAAEILAKVESLSQRGDLNRPDMRFYATVILAYSKDRKVQSQIKAEALFNSTESLYKSGRSDLKPNSRIMNTMIAGWAKCNSKQKVRKAQAVLDRMTSLYESGNTDAQPNTDSYNWVIQAAAQSKGNQDLDRLQYFQIAVNNFKIVHSNENDLQPSATTYIYFLKACRSLLRKGEISDKLLQNLFSLATQNGLVSDSLFKQMKRVNPSIIETALKAEGLEFDRRLTPAELPKSWRRKLHR